ncbi:MAG: hypothetical protein ACYTKD_26335, partial [Planctomycetota bacterium]
GQKLSPTTAPGTSAPCTISPRSPARTSAWPLETGTRHQFFKALDALTRHDPGAVAEYLTSWENRGDSWRDTDRGHVLGSYFAWRCGGDREKHLRLLLKARDPYVRVAGAVYLCFEDEKAGTAELRKLTALEGDPGVWAALTLARRGDKSSMPRALEVLATLGKSNMEGVPHRNLQKRLRVLLSNVARASGLPRPSPPEVDIHRDYDRAEDRARDIHRYFARWWDAHGEKAVLRDPWLPILEKRKID